LNERIRDIGEDDEKALLIGLGRCSESYLHCAFRLYPCKLGLILDGNIVHYAAERVRLRCQIKTERQ
jgi:hypothetical protein